MPSFLISLAVFCHNSTEIEQKEKTFGNLISWIEHCRSNLNDVLALDEFVKNVAEQYDDYALIKDIQERWLDNRLGQLSELKTKLYDLGLREKKETYKSNYENLQTTFSSLKMLLQGLSKDEVLLVEDTITKLGQIDTEGIQELIKKLEELTQFKIHFKETKQLLSGNIPLAKPSLKSVTDLTKDIPKDVDPAKSDTLDIYLRKWNETDNNRTAWLEKFNGVIEDLQQEVSSWKKLPPEHQLAVELAELEALTNNLNTLEEVKKAHNGIVKVGEEIRVFLEKELKEDARDVLDMILKLRSSGKVRFSINELGDKFQTQNSLKVLLNLSEKKFISLEISTR